MAIRKFKEFIKEVDAAKDADFKVKFASPLYVTKDWNTFWDDLMMQDMEPTEFNRKAEDLGWDFSDAYKEWREDHDIDKFWDAVGKIISPVPGKYVNKKERLENTDINAEDIRDTIVDDFNEADLAQYVKNRVPTLTSLKALDVDISGYFIVEATFSEAPDDEAIKKTKEYLAGQYSDGWGEGYEQQEQKGKDSDEPDFYINTWARDKNWEIHVIK